MTILVDRQIALLCQFQGKKITVLRDFGQWKKGQSWYDIDPERVAATYEVGNVIEAAHKDGPPFQIEDLPVEAAQGWSPMISPFVASQVRSHERNGTVEEIEYLQRHKYTREEAQKWIGPACTHIRTDPILGLQVTEKIISYGLSSAGYDVRLGRDFKIFTNVNNEHPVIDPLNMPDGYFVERLDADYCIIPPHSHILGHTIEVFDVPRDILIECVGKSTYARCGIAVNVTPIEPGFKGQVVIEIANQTPLPCKVYSGMGIAQFLFHRADEPCQVSYGDRGGKYQGQVGIQTALV